MSCGGAFVAIVYYNLEMKVTWKLLQRAFIVDFHCRSPGITQMYLAEM